MMTRNQPCKDKSMCEGSETGSDWMRLSIRKKTWAELVKERVAREETGTIGQIVWGLWPWKGFWSFFKEH